MKFQPTLQTKRLVLRPFELSDSSGVQRLAGNIKVAETIQNVPHPYLDGMAESWIKMHSIGYEKLTLITYAITLKESDELIGAISLKINMTHKKAELAYWIGVPYWNNGYCTEASQILINFGFDQLDLNRIFALSLTYNTGSYKVMEKLGMKYEGIRRQDVFKDGVAKDLVSYSILKDEWTLN